MKRGWAIALGAVLVTAAVLGVVSNEDSPVEVSVTEVKAGDFERVVEASGEALAGEMYTVMPGVSGRVAQIYVTEGQEVKKGDKLFSFDDAEANTLLKQAQLELNAAVSAQKAQALEQALKLEEANTRQSAEVMAQAGAYQPTSEQTYASLVNEVIAQAQGTGVDLGVLNKAVEAAALLRETGGQEAEAAFVGSSLDSTLADSKKEREEQIRKSVENLPDGPEVSLCREKVRHAQETTGSLTMKSEIDGKVLGMSLKQGEIAAAGSSGIVIGDTTQMRVILHVPEYDLKNVQLGQTVVLTSNGTRGSGKVVKKSTALTPGVYGEVCGDVEVQPDSEFSPLVGASVDGEIVLAQSSDTLYVPRECVGHDDDGNFVFICEDGKAKKLSVLTGLENDFYIEIKSGVVAGDVLVIAPYDLRDGAKIQTEI